MKEKSTLGEIIKFSVVAVSIGSLLLLLSANVSAPLEGGGTLFAGPARIGHGWPWPFVICVQQCELAWDGLWKSGLLASILGGGIYLGLKKLPQTTKIERHP